MNYDKAHELATAMRNSDEFKALISAQQLVEANPVAKKLVQQFMQQQMQWEYANMAKDPSAEELMKKQQELMPMIEATEGAREYLQAYGQWSQVFQDIYRIISEPVTEGMKVLNDAE